MKKSLILIISIVSLIIIVLSTNPKALPAAMLLVPFSFVLATIYMLLLYAQILIWGTVSNYATIMISLLAVVGLLLNSLGQMQKVDGWILLIMSGIMIWYLRKKFAPVARND